MSELTKRMEARNAVERMMLAADEDGTEAFKNTLEGIKLVCLQRRLPAPAPMWDEDKQSTAKIS